MAVKKLKYSCYTVSDMDSAVAFYRDALGLKLKFQDEHRWAEFDCGGNTSFALASIDEGVAEGAGTIAVLEVSGLTEMVATAVSAGAEIVSSREMGKHGRVITLRDNQRKLFQLYEPPRDAKSETGD